MVSRLVSLLDLADSGHDVWIGRTSADVAAHALPNFFVCECHGVRNEIFGDVAWPSLMRFSQHSYSGANLTGGAIAALKSVVFDESRLHYMQSIASAQSLDRRYFIAFQHHRQSQAGVDAPAIEQNRAGAALTVIATFL
jgi:hypothetical protein